MIGILCFLVGCGRIAPNPYELTKEARKEMKVSEQESFVNMIKDLEALVAALDEEKMTKEEAQNRLENFTKACPDTWQEGLGKKPIDKAWDFVMLMKSGFSGTDKYENYADCKDAVDALGKEIADCFTQNNDRRKLLIMSERAFDTLYSAGHATE